MTKLSAFWGSVALLSALSTNAMAQDVTAETVVATVGETEITLGELIVARTQLPQQYQQLPDSLLFEGLLDQLIQQQLLADTVTEVPAVVTYLLRNERRTLLASDVMTDATPTEEDILNEYTERAASAPGTPEFRASHLLVETQEEAAAAKARIDAGEAFADVAREVSTGPTGPNGGDLGWFGLGAMVPEFENQITSLEVGGVSEPFETQFGWHVATLVEQRLQSFPSLAELRGTIAAELREATISARLEELTAAADITMPEEGAFDPALINAIELLD